MTTPDDHFAESMHEPLSTHEYKLAATLLLRRPRDKNAHKNNAENVNRFIIDVITRADKFQRACLPALIPSPHLSLSLSLN